MAYSDNDGFEIARLKPGRWQREHWREREREEKRECVEPRVQGVGRARTAPRVACLHSDHTGQLKADPSVQKLSLGNHLQPCRNQIGEAVWGRDSELNQRQEDSQDTGSAETPEATSWGQLESVCHTHCLRHQENRGDQSIMA